MNQTNDEINDENRRRYDKERNEVYPEMLKNLDSLKLRRIDLRHEDRNNHWCNEISNKKYYLYGYLGNWNVGKPELCSYGWAFDVGSYTTGLRCLNILFEIENTIKYKHEPLGRLENVKDSNNERYDFDEDE